MACIRDPCTFLITDDDTPTRCVSTIAGDRMPGPEQQNPTSGDKVKDGREGVFCPRGCWWRTAQLNLCGSADNDDLVCRECSDTLDMVVNNEPRTLAPGL